MSLFSQHSAVLDRAVQALHDRTFFAHYPEAPSPDVYGADADAQGRARYEAMLGQRFTALQQPDPTAWAGQEESPYTGQPLGIEYPYFEPATLIERARGAFDAWRKTSAQDRAALLIEALDGVKHRFFDIAYATMHTTGQAYMMSFQASGPHAADRALEAIASGYEELTRFPSHTTWEKPMGKYNLKINKEWRAVPKGIALAIGCSTFPTWNTVPGMFASLVTGNPVIVKPHPKAVLPIALVVAEVQRVMAAHGLPAAVCQLAVDAADHLITQELAENPAVKIIDYTGGAVFGDYIEQLAAKGKATFTEKTGVNSIILDSCADLDKVVQNLAFSVSLYSGQMCTAPQNFFVPAAGVKVGDEMVAYDDVVQKLAGAINALATNPKAGPHVLGAIQNPATQDRVTAMAGAGLTSALASGRVENPQFADARTCSPMLLEVSADQEDQFSRELFGPIALVIKTRDSHQSVELAARMAAAHGAISCGAYTTDAALKAEIKDQMSLAGTPVSFNLTGNIYVNQNAAFSDYHVTGGNPSGNASLTNPEFVLKRFTWVGFREPAE